MVLKIVV